MWSNVQCETWLATEHAFEWFNSTSWISALPPLPLRHSPPSGRGRGAAGVLKGVFIHPTGGGQPGCQSGTNTRFCRSVHRPPQEVLQELHSAQARLQTGYRLSPGVQLHHDGKDVEVRGQECQYHPPTCVFLTTCVGYVCVLTWFIDNN